MITPRTNCTIYLLTNKVNRKVYVGQTWMTCEERMGRNGNNYCGSSYLYSAIQKHGYENFQYEILAECIDQSVADWLESYCIDYYDSMNRDVGYNLKEGGSAGKHCEATKLKISETMKNKIWSSEALEARSRWGKCWKGKARGPHTEEWKEANSKMMIERHAAQGHPMLGKHHSDEAKAKISAAGIGRVISQETIDKRDASRKRDIEKEKEIIKAYQEDILTTDQMEEKYGVLRSGIYRILFRHNIPNKVKHKARSPRKPKEPSST